MPTYLYCLLTTPSDASADVPTGLTGVAGEDVRRLDVDGLVAWVGTLRSGSASRTIETARAHDRVVRAAFDSGLTTLPARSGQVFRGDAECAEDLARRGLELRAALARIEGCVEMMVHVALTGQAASVGVRRVDDVAGTPVSAGEARTTGMEFRKGRAYLTEVRERLRLERDLQVEAASARTAIAAGLEDLVHAETSTLHPGPPPRLAIAHLVGRLDEPRYRAALDARRSAQGPTIIDVAGPYPPYSFTRLGDG